MLLQRHTGHLGACYQRGRQRLRARVLVSAQGLVSWKEVEDLTQDAPLGGFVQIPGSKPSTSPSRVVEASIDSVWSAGVDEMHPVLLLRDTDAWCPYSERVWLALEYKQIDYDTMMIDLRKKPNWFYELAPKGTVPVAKVRDRLLTESKDILLALEEEFPAPALMPEDAGKREEMMEVLDQTEQLNSTGFSFLSDGRIGGTENGDPGTSGQDRELAFKQQLDKLEAVLSKHGGPFIFGSDLTLADVMYIQPLERLGAQLPVAKGFRMRDNAQYPGLSSWYRAMADLPAYQKVMSDDRTIQLLMRNVFQVRAQHVAEVPPRQQAARLEAAAKLGRNHGAVLDDILNNSGITRARTSQYGGTVSAVNGYPSSPGPQLVAAVDHAIRRVCHQLLHGTSGERFDCKEACAIGSAALVFFRDRASAPRDMTAAAAVELREACSQVLLNMF